MTSDENIAAVVALTRAQGIVARLWFMESLTGDTINVLMEQLDADLATIERVLVPPAARAILDFDPTSPDEERTNTAAAENIVARIEAMRQAENPEKE